MKSKDSRNLRELKTSLMAVTESGVMDLSEISNTMQTRVDGTDHALVATYQAAMEQQIENEGKHAFPPLTVAVVETEALGEVGYLVDGYHRFFALHNLGIETTEVEVIYGVTKEEAWTLAAAANLNHGRKSTSEDLAALISRMLENGMLPYERFVDDKKATSNKKELAAFFECSVMQMTTVMSPFDKELKKARDYKIKLAEEAGLSVRKTSEITGVPVRTIYNEKQGCAKNKDFKNGTPNSLEVDTVSDEEKPWDDDDLFIADLEAAELEVEPEEVLKKKLEAVNKANKRGWDTINRQIGAVPKKVKPVTVGDAARSISLVVVTLTSFMKEQGALGNDGLRAVADYISADAISANDLHVLMDTLDNIRRNIDEVPAEAGKEAQRSVVH